MKDFNLHKFLRDNPLTKQKNTIKKSKLNEAFEGFKGTGNMANVDAMSGGKPQSPHGWIGDEGQPEGVNTWIADIDRMPEVGGWKASWEYPGVIAWTHPEVPTAQVVATPGWDGKGTPVEFQSEAGSSQMLKVLDQDEFPTFKQYVRAIKPYLDMVLDANVNPTSMDYEKSSIKAPEASEFQGVHENQDDLLNKIQRWLHTTTEPFDDFEFDGVDTVTLYDEDGNQIEQLSVSKDMGIDNSIMEGLAGMKTLFVMDYNSGRVFSKMVSADMQSEEIEEMLANEYGMNPNDVYYMITYESEIRDLDGGDEEEVEEGYMGTKYDSSEDMAVDMVKKGIYEEDLGSEKDSMIFSKGWQWDDDDDDDFDPKQSSSSERMDGLVNQRELAKFAEAAMAIAQDLDDDGFDASDIKRFLIAKLDDMIVA